jgi:hypothetical protein
MRLRLPQTHPIPVRPPAKPPCLVPRFASQPMRKPHWCWAACAEMVLGSAGFAVDKFDIASALFNLNCRAARPGNPCDQTLDDDEITDLYDNQGLVRPVYTAGQIGLALLVAEIGMRPVQLGITWTGSGKGHVVLVCGCDDGTSANPSLTICDPRLKGPGTIRWLALQQAYRPGAEWDATWTDLKK